MSNNAASEYRLVVMCDAALQPPSVIITPLHTELSRGSGSDKRMSNANRPRRRKRVRTKAMVFLVSESARSRGEKEIKESSNVIADREPSHALELRVCSRKMMVLSIDELPFFMVSSKSFRSETLC